MNHQSSAFAQTDRGNSSSVPARIAAFITLTLLIGCKAAIDLHEEQPFRCVRGAESVDAGACPFGLHCGVGGFCYSLENGPQGDAGLACEPDAGDCAAGWFCGHDLMCHRADLAADYACANDEHCVGGWRCGPDSRCIDPREDALRVDAPELQLLDAGQFTPLYPWPQVDHIAVSSPFTYQYDGGSNSEVTSVVVAHDGGLHLVVLAPRGIGREEALSQTMFLASAPLKADGGALLDLAAIGFDIYALHEDSLERYRWPATGSTLVHVASTPAIGNRLRMTTDPDPLLLELGATAMRAWSREGLATLVSPVSVDGGPAHILDIIGETFELIAATPEGMFTSPRPAPWMATDGGSELSPPQWQRASTVAFGPTVLSSCDGPAPLVHYVDRLYAMGNSNLSNGVARLSVLQPDGGRSPFVGFLNRSASAEVDCPAQFNIDGFCPACRDVDERLLDLDLRFVTGDNQQGEHHLEAACDRGGGASVIYRLGVGGHGNQGCHYEELPPPRSMAQAVVATSNPTGRAFSLGRDVYAVQEGFTRPTSLVLGRAPEMVAIVSAGGVFALGSREFYREVPGLGLGFNDRSERPEDPFPIAVVENQTNWIIYDDGRVADTERISDGSDGPEIVVAPDPAMEALRPPFNARRTDLLGGGAQLVMTAFDAILGADLAAALDGGVSTLEVKTVPQPRIPILSMVALPEQENPPAGAPLLSGYVLTRNGLFEFRAFTLQRWQTQEVLVPAGEWLEVWADERRGRLGYSDGTVYALPSRVMLAKPFTGKKVVDYAHFCGRSFALVTDGLYRLEAPTSGGLGAWEKQDVPALEQVGGQLDGSKLYISGSTLFAFTSTGIGVRMVASPCAP
jgi:hypothetical protein